MLRVRTGYSFRHAAGDLKDVMSRLKEIGATAAPITDTASTFGWAQWKKLAEKEGLKPVFGVEIAVSPSVNEKKPVSDHWMFIPRKDVSVVNQIVQVATEQFRYQPLLSTDQAFTYAGACDVIVGHKAQLDWERRPPKGAWLGLSPATQPPYLRRAMKAGWKLVATGDNRYPRETDKGFYEVLAGRNAQSQTYPQHILSQKEWCAAVARCGLSQAELKKAISNSAAILGAADHTLARAQLPQPHRPATLLKMCQAGAKKLGCDLKNKTYAARLKRELALIEQKGYEDYFYIVAELCQWARKKMIVGPARGSSCGSLVCYLLEITTIDPIPHGLIFERFIDINRNDMPDIDIDFSDQLRHLVFEHLGELYGRECVARIGTVSTYGPASALDEVGKALKIPKWELTGVNESIIKRSSGDNRAMQTLEDTLNTTEAGKKLLIDHPEAIVVTKFEGHPRHYSQHAAGVVLARDSITNYVAIDARTNATMCDKEDAEGAYNLLKIDALGLTQLSVFEDTLKMVGKRNDFLLSLPLDDAMAFKVLNDGKFSGVFQFNGHALQSLASQINVDKFNDIVSITALARPGPMASGGAAEWVRRRNGTHPVTYPHEMFEPYMNDTFGVVLYQEQVMEIGRNIGDLGWPEVTALRKAMSKSLGKEYFDQFGDPWKRAAIAKGLDPAHAEKVWDELCAYGAWSFNKSHSVAYGYLSYWCCWLKAHYPFEFAAATLSHENNPAKQIVMLREMVAEGYDYAPFDKWISGDKWTVHESNGKKTLVGPLTLVYGIGPALMQQVLSSRKRKDPLPARAEKILNNGKTPIDTLWPIRDAFKRVMPDPLQRNISTPNTLICDLVQEYESKYVVIFCVFEKINLRDENEAINVSKRGYAFEDGLHTSLSIRLADDTGAIQAKINRFKFPRMGAEIVGRGRLSKALYAVSGKLLGHGGKEDRKFKFISIDRVKYIGDIDFDVEGSEGVENDLVTE